MGIRLIAAVLAMFCGAFFGLYRSEKLKKYVIVCTESDKVFRLAETLIRSCGTDIFSIFTVLKRENFSELGFISKLSDEYSAEIDFHSQWRRLLTNEADIPHEEKRILLDFGELLGTSDIDGQLDGITALRSLMQERYEQRSAEYHSKAKLYRSVGVLTGVMVGIMVI